MNAGDHAALVAWFDRLVALPPAQRPALLDTCEPALRARLEALLAADAGDGDPVGGVVGAAAGASMATAPAGSRIGAYRVLGELGAGGMGAVLLAERDDGQFRQRVAIKLIRGFPTTEGKRRLRQERQILAQLDHPNIARLIDGGETADGQPYVVMECVDGVPLLEYAATQLSDHGVPSTSLLQARLVLFDAIADAVQHAHGRLVIHRDLKPGNVLVRADGQPKLLDFGIAMLVDLSAASDPRQTSTRVWTPGYAAPEQQQGRAITTATDVFGLGGLLRELLTGERAPGRPGVLPAGFRPLSLDADLRGILGKAQSDRPEDRYATVEALRDDVRRWADGRPVRAAADSALYRLRKFVGRHRLGVAFTVVLITGTLAVVWQIARERARALDAEARATAALHAAEREAATARSALQFLTDAFAAAMPEHAMSAQVSVRDLLDHARGRLDARSIDNPALLRAMQRILGHLYGSLGEPAIAVTLFEAGLAGAEAHERADALALADDYDGYAAALGVLERGAEGLAMAQRSAGLRQHFAPDDPEQRLRALDQLGSSHYRVQDFDRAEADWTGALAIAATLQQPPVDIVTNIHQALGAMLVFQGEHARALTLADAGLVFADRHLPADSPLRVNLLRTRGEALWRAGRPVEGEAELRAAIDLQTRVVGPRGTRLATLLNGLGLVLNDQGRYREALDVLRRSEAMAAEAGSAPYDDAITLSNIAAVMESAGAYDDALALFDRALRRLDAESPDPDVLARRIMARNHARCLALAGRFDEAVALLDHLRERARRLDGVDTFEYAMVTWQRVVLARRMGDVEGGAVLLDDARQRFGALLPEGHPVFLHMQRVEADLALRSGRLEHAERIQRAALAGFEQAGFLPVDLAIARAELAAILKRRGQRAEARRLLDAALPVLRESLLPTEVSRAAAEQLETRL